MHSLGLPPAIDLDLQRAIYTARQQGTPGQLAAVYIQFDPNILTISATVALARQHGMDGEYQFERSNYVSGPVALDAIPRLAAEKGITSLGLKEMMYLDEPRCPPLGRATPVPVTCGPP